MVRFEKQEERHYSPREPQLQHSRGRGPSGGEGVQLDWTLLNANLPTCGLWVP